MKIACDNCNQPHRDIRRTYRLNPTNWQPTYQRLCQPCRKTNPQWALVDHGRGYQEATSKTGGGGRPW